MADGKISRKMFNNRIKHTDTSVEWAGEGEGATKRQSEWNRDKEKITKCSFIEKCAISCKIINSI